MITPLFTDASNKRRQIRAKAIAGLNALFPVEEGNMKIAISHLKVADKDYSINDAKKALLSGGSLSEPMYGKIVATKDGKVIFTKDNYLFMRIPFLTDQQTFIVGGNSYMIGNQLRTRPGIYARFRRNDVPEVSFNLAKGANFKITMEPSSLKFNMEFGASKIPLYPVVKALGFSDPDMRKMWGHDVHRANTNITETAQTAAIDKLYSRLIHAGKRSEGDSKSEKIQKLRVYFSQTNLDSETTKLTVGMSFKNVNGLAMAVAAKKLINIYKKNEDVDDRDSLEFQKIHSIDDFIQERIQKGGKEVVQKLKFRIKRMKPGDDIKKHLSAAPFSKTVNSLVTQFNLSRTPDQINPIEILDGVMKVTRMGEGGISSQRAVPEATRELHVSHVGVLDPVRTPESHNIGVDLRASIRMGRDEEGRIYAPVINVKTKKFSREYVGDLKHKVVAFANQKLSGTVDATYKGKVIRVAASRVDFQLPHSQDMFGPSTTLVPFIGNMQGNRALMASKQITQALPLKYREEPLVQVTAPTGSTYGSMHREIGSHIIKTAPEDGKVTKMDDDYIHFRGKSGAKHKLAYASNFPFNSKTYLNEDLVSPIGKSIKKGEPITNSNFTRNGAVALGINAKVAYVPYYGENSNDAIVISEDAAKKFTSLHMYKETLEKDRNTITKKAMWIAKYPNKYSGATLRKYGDNGIAYKGISIDYGEPVILALRKSEANQTDIVLGRLDKSLRTPYRDASVVWQKEDPGVVTDIFDSEQSTTVTLKVESVAREGDKISGLHGNKGVIGKIVPNERMLRGEDNKPLDVLVTSAGVMTRINPSQILETATGKAADKLGKPITIDNFSPENDVKRVKSLLAKLGLKDKETVTDPVTGRKIPNIFIGKQYMAKLFKSTDTNFAARATSGYSIDEQPTKGGKTSASRMGPMEVNALLAHGTPDLLREMGQLKSQKNIEWWQAYQQGRPTPKIKRPFIVDKFHGMLEGAQIKVTERGGKLLLSPQTDKYVLSKSSGMLTNVGVLRKKDLRPEIGGLFDPVRTGGLEGEKWSHLELPERIVKPVYRKAAASLLGISSKELDRQATTKGGDAIHDMLKRLNLKQLKADSYKEANTASGVNLDKAVKRLKFIKGLERAGVSPQDAYTGKTVPVIPPKMRPIVPGPNNSLLVADANHLYRETMLASKKLQEMKDLGLPSTDIADMRRELTLSVGAIVGLNDPTNKKLQQQEKKGFIKKLSGYKPSEGMFQRKIVGRAQDISGRATIAPDPTLGVDEIGLPEDTAYGMYAPMVMRNLVRRGYQAMDATKHIKDRTPSARRALEEEAYKRPIIYNRAPTLTRNSMLAAYPKIVPGKTIRINPYSEGPLNADFDGDTVQLHAPVSDRAIADSKKLLLSNLLFSDKNTTDLQVKPQHEAIIGIHDVLSQKASNNTFKFRSLSEAKAAYLRGEIKANDNVDITG